MSTLVPGIILEDAAGPLPKRRRLNTPPPDYRSHGTGPCLLEDEAAAQLDQMPTSSTAHGHIHEETIVCFGMVRQMLLWRAIIAYAR